jgi:cobalamin biosynthesis protein CobD/CbiB
MLHDRLKETFAKGYTPSSLIVAQELFLYTETRSNSDHDQQVARMLRQHGYLPTHRQDSGGFIPGRTEQEKSAYQMIGHLIESLENPAPSPT